jgi:type IV pilus assembly protein PilV
LPVRRFSYFAAGALPICPALSTLHTTFQVFPVLEATATLNPVSTEPHCIMRTDAIKHIQHGFSLVEVMVSAVIFSLGLGGLSLMMLTSVHGTQKAQDQTVAAMQASSLAELILMNPAAIGHYINPVPASLEDCTAPTGCAGAAWAAGNLARWQFELEQNLPGAAALVCRDGTPDDGQAGEPACDGAGLAVVKVFWADTHHRDEARNGLQRVVVKVER